MAARKRNFLAFALQNGGFCASGSMAWKTFYKYGQSTDCKDDGEGGFAANNVYVFHDEEKCKFRFPVVYKDLQIDSIGN